MRSNGIILSAAMLVLAACGRDAAAEAPVQMRPGVYEISAPGGILDQLNGPGEIDDRHCLAPGSEEAFPRIVLRPMLELQGCSDADFDRRGNLIMGSAVCTIDPNHGAGQWELAARAMISADRLDAKLEFKIDPELLNDPEAKRGYKMIERFQNAGLISVTAERIGDC